MIVTFCGHRTVYPPEPVRAWLRETVEGLVARGADRFYLGGYGAFDDMAAVTLQDMHTSHPGIESVLVLAYLGRPLDEFDRQLYDRTTCPPLESVPKRYAILRRNEWMAANSDVVVAYVTHDWGGAASMLNFARRKKKEIICYGEDAPWATRN